MKLSLSLSVVLAILPALVAAASPLDSRSLNGDMYFPRHHARHFGRQRQGAFGGGRQGAGNRGGQGQGQQGAANKSKSQSSTSVAAPATNNAGTASTTTAAAAANNAAASTTAAATSQGQGRGRGGNRNKNGGGNNAAQSTTAAAAAASSDVTGSVADNSNPDTSLTLLSELVATGLEQDGQATPTAGQVPSLTSKNNFINFCAGKTITNGQQITTGSCDPIPMGDIVPKANMPRSKFKNPTNFSKIKANQAFTIQMVLENLQAGVFTNAQKTYYMAPQQLNGQKILIGHTHVVIQPMGDFASPNILDPATFTFFKGINTGQDGNGVVTADVTAGVPPGNYRLASINTDSNHAPAVVAVAQHGCLDDMIYFTAE